MQMVMAEIGVMIEYSICGTGWLSRNLGKTYIRFYDGF